MKQFISRTKEYISDRIKDKDIELLLFALVLISMSIYYAWRMFRYAPWYDELYTYYYFISRGPIYSAIHWPVPNNHIFYSVLSGILDLIFSNSFIGLRGISFLSSIANICLIFAICRRLFPQGFSLMTVAVYMGMWLVNNLAVQGRGYTLSTTMELVALLCLVRIIFDEPVGRKYYILWAVSLTAGLYTVTTSLFWVIPVCLCAGIVMCVYKRFRELLKLVWYSVIAAAATFLLYLTVWLAIGSNLLIKEEASFGGYGHVKLILSHPVKAAARGIEYMLASPYIQSVSPDGYFSAFLDHMSTLLSQMYDTGWVIKALLLCAVVFSAIVLVGKKTGRQLRVLSIFVLVLLLATPLSVIVQFKLPYFRVFSFWGFAVALSIVYVLYFLFGGLKKHFHIGILLMLLALVFTQLARGDYNTSYGSREQAIYDLMTQTDLSVYSRIALTDCNQEYMYKFIYGKEYSNPDIKTADAVIIYRDMLDPNAPYAWENYVDYSSLDMDYLASMTETYENELYILYTKQ